MNTAELRRLAEAVLLIEKESAKWAAGIPDSQEREAVEHGVRLATAIIQFRDAARNPKDVLSFLDRLDAAEKVCAAANEYVKTRRLDWTASFKDFNDRTNQNIEKKQKLTDALAKWKEAQ